MDPSILIPTPDAIPVPHPWFQALLLLTFLLHILFMNTMLGVTIIEIVRNLKGKPAQSDFDKDTAKKLPFLIAFTINLGVAPLLFTQVLYGQFLYTSSVLMAGYWLSVIAILILLYYGAYLYYLKFEQLGRARGYVIGFTGLLMLTTGFFLSTNMSLMVQPDKWPQYFNKASGLILNLSDPAFWPRYLHFMTASVAIGGLAIAIYYNRKTQKEAVDRVHSGLKWFAHGTSMQFIIGFWFLFALPDSITRQFIGGNLHNTIILSLGIITGFISMLAAFRKKLGVTLVSLIASMIFMVIARDALRKAYLEPYFKVSSLSVNTDYSSLILFLVTFLIGIFCIVLMLKWAARSMQEVTE